MVQSKYTKDEPFEFESYYGTVIKVWPHVHNGISDVMVKFGLNPAYSISRESARAVLAFDATENPDTWAWTNDDHTEARKGRWVAFACEGGSCDLEHDDLPGLTWYADESAVPASIAGVRESYQAWKSAQNQPSEPAASKFGYVGTKDDKDVFRSENGTYGLVSRETGNWIEGLTWSEVCKFDGEFKEVPRG